MHYHLQTVHGEQFLHIYMGDCVLCASENANNKSTWQAANTSVHPGSRRHKCWLRFYILQCLSTYTRPECEQKEQTHAKQAIETLYMSKNATNKLLEHGLNIQQNLLYIKCIYK